MSLEEAELMRKRAEAFLRNAKRLIDEGEYDLAMFNIEQYCQLMLKYKLLVERGSYPRTHSLRALLRVIGEEKPEVLFLIEDEKYLHYIARIEEAYIISRYLPYTYDAKEVSDVYNFVIEVFRKVVEKV